VVTLQTRKIQKRREYVTLLGYVFICVMVMYLGGIKMKRFLHFSLVIVVLHHAAARTSSCDTTSPKRVDGTLAILHVLIE
jgi:hypothetical protein